MKFFAAAVLVAGSLSAHAAPLVYSDSNESGLFWARPVGAGPSISGLGPVQYHLQPFFTDTSGLYDISSVQSYDGYLHLYAGSFDPLDQLAGLIAGDDDGVGGIGTSDIDAIGLIALTQYFLVTSGFAAGDYGTFTNTIELLDGDATISAGRVGQQQPSQVPEPGTLALLGLGLAGMGFARRSKKA